MRVRGVRLLSLLLNLNRLLLGAILMGSGLTVAEENLDVEIVAASGTYYFGPSMSELDACSKAQHGRGCCRNKIPYSPKQISKC